MDAREVGLIAGVLGVAERKGQPIDPAVGLEIGVKVGQLLRRQLLAVVHARSQDECRAAQERLLRAKLGNDGQPLHHPRGVAGVRATNSCCCVRQRFFGTLSVWRRLFASYIRSKTRRWRRASPYRVLQRMQDAQAQDSGLFG